MHKNLCSGCNLNFDTLEAFDAHHVGDFGNNRHCLTSLEMQAKGWIYSEPFITYYQDGKAYQKVTPTWSKPLNEKRQAHYQHIHQQKLAASLP